MTEARSLDRRIVIERLTEGAQNGFGEPAETWATLATVWAGRKDVSDSEKVQAGQRSSALMSRFVVRDLGIVKTVNSKDRLNYLNRTWNILGAKETIEGGNRFREITAISESD
jgi:SPP1 family predicted phage head-tail adaptor